MASAKDSGVGDDLATKAGSGKPRSYDSLTCLAMSNEEAALVDVMASIATPLGAAAGGAHLV